ncbi:UDP-glucose/GDP-mannose dehydrogenase family protein [Candidatus Saccharibacteria bacterium]|nr:UDP-glucose/GDP-mannose dehydrogenase family protein [Candidatus Saccharibacteria bacterium]
MNITVVGTGYVGLVTGTCFAEMGNNVSCVDIDEVKIKKLQKGRIPIYEPELEDLFKKNIDENRLSFTTDLREGVKKAQFIFLALPTPPGDDGSADLSYILGVAEELGKILDHYAIVIDKSTVPVGTADKVSSQIAKNIKVDFDVVSNPEFLREGFAVSDFMNPDRVVIGTSSEKAKKLLEELYSPFVREGNPIYFMDEKSAEMTKYAANAFLATKISFMNEVANLCEQTGADVDSVRLGIGSDERIGKRFLFPGIGYGGSCFPKDVLALNRTAQEHDYTFQILESVMDVNSYQKKRLANKVRDYFKGDISGKTFALWGLAFKPDTDDIREAPALEIIQTLTQEGANVVAFDPEAIENTRKIFKENRDVSFVENEYEALKDADALIIATEWEQFRAPDFAEIKKLLKKPIVFDGRNLYEPKFMKNQGFYYESIGRNTVTL